MTKDSTQALPKDVEERFDKQFGSSINLITTDGGFELTPYLKAFIANELAKKDEEMLGFHNFVNIIERFLEQYPDEVFTGSSGDSGAVFIVNLRNAVMQLKKSLKE